MSIDVLQEKIRKTKCPVMLELAASICDLPPHLLSEAPSPAEAYARVCRELLEALPNDRIILTGVGEEDTGLLLRDCGEVKRYAHPRLPGSFSGTGDLFAAAFAGALAAEKGLYESARIAADFTYRCIQCTAAEPAQWYGIKFEPVLPELMRMLGIK